MEEAHHQVVHVNETGHSPRASGLAATAALLAGMLWLAVWAHQMAAHGRSQVNEMNLSLGLTWMDSGKFLVLCFLLLIPGIRLISRRVQGPDAGAMQRMGSIVVGILSLAALGTALEFWFFEWGSYAETFESKGGITTVGIPLQAFFSALLLPIASIVFGVTAARRSVMPYWLVIVLFLGSLATVFLTPVFFVPGVAWSAFGLWLLLDGRRGTRDSTTS